MHIRVDDQVKVMSGSDRGVQARVLRVMHDEGKVVVEGVNKVFKHMRKSQQNPKGGRLEKNMPVSISTVRLVCPSCGQAARTGIKFRADGSKHRACKKCKSEIGEISPGREKKLASRSK
ncbi:MAG: 50S ribosomal protein L24 [Planctomycetota bacterium]|nr:50S ribosomal protein L24 [Planctomycetota bacterium]